jgi:hypothetical protein
MCLILSLKVIIKEDVIFYVYTDISKPHTEKVQQWYSETYTKNYKSIIYLKLIWEEISQCTKLKKGLTGCTHA